MMFDEKPNIGNSPASPGNAEFQAIKDNNYIDMGNIPSRDLGNMLSGQLVELGKMAIDEYAPNTDLGSLPSRSLTRLGKEVVAKTDNSFQ